MSINAYISLLILICLISIIACNKEDIDSNKPCGNYEINISRQFSRPYAPDAETVFGDTLLVDMDGNGSTDFRFISVNDPYWGPPITDYWEFWAEGIGENKVGGWTGSYGDEHISMVNVNQIIGDSTVTWLSSAIQEIGPSGISSTKFIPLKFKHKEEMCFGYLEFGPYFISSSRGDLGPGKYHNCGEAIQVED